MLCAAVACICMMTPPALARPDQLSLAPTARMTALAAALAADPRTPATDLMAAAGLSDVLHMPDYALQGEPKWSPRPGDAVDAGPMNLRLSLTMLSQAYGNEDNGAILGAQPSADSPALVLRAGTATLDDLRRILRDARLQDVPATGPLTLQVPLVIWAGAAMQLRPGEVLQLDRAAGAFVMNFGLLQINGAKVSATPDRNPRNALFVPFITTADGGVVQVQGARFSRLGFGKSQKFSGFAIMQGTIRSPRQPSWVENSAFDNVMSVSVSMARDVVVRGNHFTNMRGVSLVLSRTAGASVLLNLFSGQMRQNAVVLEQGSTDGRIAGNVVMAGKRTGIVVRDSSTSAVVAHNIVWQRDGGGIALIKSDCGLITENLVLDNDQKGIEVRTSLESEVIGNAILANHSAGIWVSAQVAGATTFVRTNVLAENGAGMSAADGASILLDGNDFSQQFQQFLSGDLAPQSAHIARNVKGSAVIVLTAGGTSAPTNAKATCPH